MKLIKQFAGNYKGQQVVDGLNVELEVSSLEKQGFCFSYYVNGKLMYDDGWYGLRLKDIKYDMDINIKRVVEEYKEYIEENR